MRTAWCVVLLAAAAALSPACAYFRGEVEPYRAPNLSSAPGPERGRLLYMRDCAWCHGSRGRGTQRAPDVVFGTNGPAFTDFMLRTGRMPIRSPDEPVRRGEPAYNPGERRDIVAFMQTLGPLGPGIPEPHPEVADLVHGGRLYQENCAACHSTTGVGAALTPGRNTSGSGLVAPSLHDSSPIEIAEAMLVGPGTMPVFGPGTFSEKEADAVIRYVRYLRRPRQPGGADIGGVGPVTEGAVALFAGLGAVVLLIRWIGTKRGELE